MIFTIEGIGALLDGDTAVMRVQASLWLPDGTLVDSFPGEVDARRIAVPRRP